MHAQIKRPLSCKESGPQKTDDNCACIGDAVLSTLIQGQVWLWTETRSVPFMRPMDFTVSHVIKEIAGGWLILGQAIGFQHASIVQCFGVFSTDLPAAKHELSKWHDQQFAAYVLTAADWL